MACLNRCIPINLCLSSATIVDTCCSLVEKSNTLVKIALNLGCCQLTGDSSIKSRKEGLKGIKSSYRPYCND